MTKQEVVAAINESTNDLLSLISPLTEEKFNASPFEGSWTSAQLIEHIRKSDLGMAKALISAGTGNRESEKINNLQQIFLNFERTFDAPEFIIPEDKKYNKKESIKSLEEGRDKIAQLANTVDLTEVVPNPILGDLTKSEYLHFIVYHTKRHIHQLKNKILA